MSIFATIEKDFKTIFSTSEAFVLKAIADMQRGVTVAESDLRIAIGWVNGHASDIAAAVTTVQGVVGSLVAAGVSVPPSVLTAVHDANIGMSALNAYVATAQAGGVTPQALVDGYVAAKRVAQAAASASIAVATNPVASPAIPPSQA